MERVNIVFIFVNIVLCLCRRHCTLLSLQLNGRGQICLLLMVRHYAPSDLVFPWVLLVYGAAAAAGGNRRCLGSAVIESKDALEPMQR